MNGEPGAQRRRPTEQELSRVQEHISSLGLDCEVQGFGLKVAMSNGKKKRDISLEILHVSDHYGISRFLEIPYASLKYIDEYIAVYDAETGVIEAAIGAPIMFANPYTRIPGFSDLGVIAVEELGDGWVLSENHQFFPIQSMRSRTRNWRIPFQGDGVVDIEISPASSDLQLLEGHALITVKVKGMQIITHDAALNCIDDVIRGVIFELDRKYAIHASLMRERKPRSKPRSTPVSPVPPRVPALRYDPRPLALYEYGRSASGLPLLEFLAYYQVLEFYFPLYLRHALLGHVRGLLKDPRFNIDDDLAVGNLISRAELSSGFVSERQQLRETLRACVSANELKDLIESSDEDLQHFTATKSIQGIDKISMHSNAPDLRDQVADRIYGIRCRVVHTKQNAQGDPEVELLLPSGKEVKSLGPDIELLRELAQRALVTGARQIRKIDP